MPLFIFLPCFRVLTLCWTLCVAATSLCTTSTSAFTSYCPTSGSLSVPSTVSSPGGSGLPPGVAALPPSPCHKGCGGLLPPGLSSCTSCGPGVSHPVPAGLQQPLHPRPAPGIYDPHNPMHPFVRHPYFGGKSHSTNSGGSSSETHAFFVGVHWNFGTAVFMLSGTILVWPTANLKRQIGGKGLINVHFLTNSNKLLFCARALKQKKVSLQGNWIHWFDKDISIGLWRVA